MLSTDIFKAKRYQKQIVCAEQGEVEWVGEGEDTEEKTFLFL